MQREYKTSKATIKNHLGNHRLYVNGSPFWIKGAGLEYENVESLALHGGNSFRTWRVNNGKKTAKEVLDKAWEYGLYVAMGIDMGKERHGFDYNDSVAIQAQFERIKEEVESIKNHPALIIWVIGNELNLNSANLKVWDAVNEVSEYLHQTDPYHLTTTALAGIDEEVIEQIKTQVPDIDILSVQLYADILNLPIHIKNLDWKKPYMITEWGATGHWEVRETAWGAPVENTSTLKAKLYLERYRQAIAAEREKQCLGSYVFLWGQKQERTPTWYGVFLASGEETEAVDVMHYIWNAQWPSCRAPQVHKIMLNELSMDEDIYLTPKESYPVEVIAEDKDGDALSFYWEVKPESAAISEGGDYEEEPVALSGLIQKKSYSAHTQLTTPQKEGAYRLFVYVKNGKNHAGHANIPFYVKN